VKTKNELIIDVLKRWWYCMPDWPPVGFDYQKKLDDKNLRVVKFIS